MTQDAPLDQKALEAAKAVEDDMRWMAADRHRDIQPLVRERLIEGADMIERFRDALSRRVPASGGETEPPAVALLRGLLSKRATSAEFNEWQAREVVAYIDRILAASPRVAAPEGWLWKRHGFDPWSISREMPTDATFVVPLYATPSKVEGKAEPQHPHAAKAE